MLLAMLLVVCRVLMAFLESDSTVVYYQMSLGLVPPERPEEIEEKKQTRFMYQQRRKQRHIKYVAACISGTSNIHVQLMSLVKTWVIYQFDSVKFKCYDVLF